MTKALNMIQAAGCVVVGVALCYLSSGSVGGIAQVTDDTKIRNEPVSQLVDDAPQEDRHKELLASSSDRQEHRAQSERLDAGANSPEPQILQDQSGGLLEADSRQREKSRTRTVFGINGLDEREESSSRNEESIVRGAIFDDSGGLTSTADRSTNTPASSPPPITLTVSSSPIPSCKIFGDGGVCLDGDGNFYDSCFGKLDVGDHQTCKDLCTNRLGPARCHGISYGVTAGIKYCYLHLSTVGDARACDDTNLLFADYVTDGAGEIRKLFPFAGYKCYTCQ